MDDDEEVQEMYGPQCWYGSDADPGRFKKTMWLEFTKEFNCKAVATGPSCGRLEGESFQHTA